MRSFFHKRFLSLLILLHSRAPLGSATQDFRANSSCNRPWKFPACDIGAGDPDGSPFAFWMPSRKDRVLRLRVLNLHQARPSRRVRAIKMVGAQGIEPWTSPV